MIAFDFKHDCFDTVYVCEYEDVHASGLDLYAQMPFGSNNDWSGDMYLKVFHCSVLIALLEQPFVF